MGEGAMPMWEMHCPAELLEAPDDGPTLPGGHHGPEADYYAIDIGDGGNGEFRRPERTQA